MAFDQARQVMGYFLPLVSWLLVEVRFYFGHLGVNCRCCVQCGRVLEDTAFAADVAFAKDAAGESTVVGQFVNESGQARGLGRIHGGKIYSYQVRRRQTPGILMRC